MNCSAIYTTKQTREIEDLAVSKVQHSNLMELAGFAIAQKARMLMGDQDKSVLVLAGPGNNGGDAFEAACHLKKWFYRVTVIFFGESEKLSADAKAAYNKWKNSGGTLSTKMPVSKSDLIIDGFFGIGLQRDLGDSYNEIINAVNQSKIPVLAIDVPSGLNADTGQVMGNAIKATHTVTFFGLKPGLLTLDGPDYCGEITIDPLGINPISLLPPKALVINKNLFSSSLKPRLKNSHKGMMGSVGIIGGDNGMIGAVLLAGCAALKLGAGRVYLGPLADSSPSIDVNQPELMLRQPEQLLNSELVNCLAIGPGMGQTSKAHSLLQRALSSTLSIVCDADALNLIALHEELQKSLATRQSFTLLTPHPAEAARLLGKTTTIVQQDRVSAALELSKRFRCGVALKGVGSILAFPDGRWFINTTGNPGMASAGMGDVLTGLLAALLAQGWSSDSALLAGVYLHATAADDCIAAGVGPVGLTASEVIDAARDKFNRWISEQG